MLFPLLLASSIALQGTVQGDDPAPDDPPKFGQPTYEQPALESQLDEPSLVPS